MFQFCSFHKVNIFINRVLVTNCLKTNSITYSNTETIKLYFNAYVCCVLCVLSVLLCLVCVKLHVMCCVVFCVWCYVFYVLCLVSSLMCLVLNDLLCVLWCDVCCMVFSFL